MRSAEAWQSLWIYTETSVSGDTSIQDNLLKRVGHAPCTHLVICFINFFHHFSRDALNGAGARSATFNGKNLIWEIVWSEALWMLQVMRHFYEQRILHICVLPNELLPCLIHLRLSPLHRSTHYCWLSWQAWSSPDYYIRRELSCQKFEVVFRFEGGVSSQPQTFTNFKSVQANC